MSRAVSPELPIKITQFLPYVIKDVYVVFTALVLHAQKGESLIVAGSKFL